MENWYEGKRSVSGEAISIFLKANSPRSAHYSRKRPATTRATYKLRYLPPWLTLPSPPSPCCHPVRISPSALRSLIFSVITAKNDRKTVLCLYVVFVFSTFRVFRNWLYSLRKRSLHVPPRVFHPAVKSFGKSSFSVPTPICRLSRDPPPSSSPLLSRRETRRCAFVLLLHSTNIFVISSRASNCYLLFFLSNHFFYWYKDYY